MLQTLFTFIGANSSLVSLGTLGLTVFFAGTMLQGERVRKQEIKAELREIQAETEASMARVQAIQDALALADAELVGQIKATYTELDSLNAEQYAIKKKLEDEQLANVQRQGSSAIRRVPASSGFDLKN